MHGLNKHICNSKRKGRYDGAYPVDREKGYELEITGCRY